MSVTAIIQARMNSSRLPGKVLMQVLGKPLLQWQLEQLRHSERIDAVVVATTESTLDAPVVKLAEELGAGVFCGPEQDVLGRYCMAARAFCAEHVMRITADCPLIQPQVCDQVIKEYHEQGAQYARTSLGFAWGLDCEIFDRASLDRSCSEAQLPQDREHVTQFILNSPDSFKIHIVKNIRDDSRYRITVDEREDFTVVKQLIEELYDCSRSFIHIDSIRRHLDEHPEVAILNAHFTRDATLYRHVNLHPESKITDQ